MQKKSFMKFYIAFNWSREAPQYAVLYISQLEMNCWVPLQNYDRSL